MRIDFKDAKLPKTKVDRDFYFAQIPLDMVGDVSPGGFMLYGVIYGYCTNWRSPNPSATVNQKTLSQETGYSVRTISKWTNELHESGWATVKQTGLNQPNSITLHGNKVKRSNKKTDTNSR